MPNWCDNTLTAQGEPEHVRAFVQRAQPRRRNVRDIYAEYVDWRSQQKPGSAIWGFEAWFAEHVRAYPISFASHVPLGDEPGAWDHDVALARWGTKWDAAFADPPVVLALPDDVCVEFWTAWTPPLEWLDAVSKAHPELAFVLRYVEVNMRFAGECRYAHGVCVEHLDLPELAEEIADATFAEDEPPAA